jgi:hypothetical protein
MKNAQKELLALVWIHKHFFPSKLLTLTLGSSPKFLCYFGKAFLFVLSP